MTGAVPRSAPRGGSSPRSASSYLRLAELTGEPLGGATSFVTAHSLPFLLDGLADCTVSTCARPGHECRHNRLSRPSTIPPLGGAIHSRVAGWR